jgi:hypothetical protein
MRLLEKLNTPQAVVVVLVIVLVTNGFLLYHYRLAEEEEDAVPSSSPPPAASAHPLAVEGGKGGGQEAEVPRAEDTDVEAALPGGEKEDTLGATQVSAEPASAGSAAYLAPEAADPATLPTAAMPAPAYSNSGYERQYGTQYGTQSEWWWVTY